jgi:hypothetical protein
MNERRAKELRKKIYGDLSIRERKYSINGKSIICTGKRAEYQRAKKGN